MNMDKALLSDNASKVKKQLEEFSTSCEQDLENYSKHLYSLREKAEKLSDSWSGSWLGFHAFLYYRDFQKPSLREGFNVEWGSIEGMSDGWQQRSFEEVKQKIETGIVKTNLDYIYDKVKPLVKQAEKLRNFVDAELSLVTSDKS